MEKLYKDSLDVYIKGSAEVFGRQCFKKAENYMLYFLIDSMLWKNDRTTVIFLNESFYMLKSIIVHKKTVPDVKAFAKLIDDEGKRAFAKYAIIFRKLAYGDMKSEFFRANSLFCKLEKVELYDYVVRTDTVYRSIIAPFRYTINLPERK